MILETTLSIFIFILVLISAVNLNFQWQCKHELSKSLLEHEESKKHSFNHLELKRCQMMQKAQMKLEGNYEFKSKR